MTELTIPETTETAGRTIVLDVVGLQPQHIDADRTPTLESQFPSERVTDLRPPFPAVTVPAQTTLATGRGPGEHGDVSSGEYDRERETAAFWERDRDGRDRIWETASDEAGLTTGALNFQHLIDTSADVAVTPSPIEDENNDIPRDELLDEPRRLLRRPPRGTGPLPLHNYWGPGANEEGSRWILAAASEGDRPVRSRPAVGLRPHLDYAGQSDGPGSDAFATALETVDDLLETFLADLSETDRWDETVPHPRQRVRVSRGGSADIPQPRAPGGGVARDGRGGRRRYS